MRSSGAVCELLIFDSHDEPGLEVPKGTVELGESLEDAVRRELLEEARIQSVSIVDCVGSARWQDEVQHGFIVEPSEVLADAFSHQVTSEGIDRNFVYRFSWFPIAIALEKELVQGCGQFVHCLLEHRGRPELKLDTCPF